MSKQSLVGAHLSIAGGIEKSFDRAREVGANCFQIFTRSSRSWNSVLYSPAEVVAFKKAQAASGIDIVVAHAPYLINLASTTTATREGSVKLLESELLRAHSLGLRCVVLHPGSHGGDGEDVGIQRFIENLDFVLARVPDDCVVALETMAGQGNSLGSTLDSLKKIYQGSSFSSRIQFCLDTCHVFSAGYDISSGVKFNAFLDEFDNKLGIEKLSVIHVNDSKTPFDARVDRHAMLGHGSIPREVFVAIMNDVRLQKIPKILETPAEKENTTYGPEIAWLRSICNK